MPSHIEIFDAVYAGKGWGVGSGPGSTASSLSAYIDFVRKVLARHQPRRILDLGCGFFAPYAGIEWGGEYLGVDAAAVCISSNAGFEGPKRRFQILDWLNAPELPDADLVLVKDVLQHWTVEEIDRGLHRLSRFPHVLITNSVILGSSPVNAPIKTGGCSPLNLLMAPWNLPRPELFESFLVPDNTELDMKLALLFQGATLRRAG